MRQEITINQTTFFVEKFPAMEQIRIFGNLQKTLLPSFGKVLGGITADNEDKKESEKHKAQMEAQFIDGLRELSQQLDGEGLIKLTEMLLKPDFVAFQRDDHNNGNDTKLTKHNMDAAFEDMGEVVELLIFVLKLNFAPFFTKYLSRLGLEQKLKA